MEQLVVEAVTTAKTGKSLRVKANGEWFGAQKSATLDKGWTILAEVEREGEYGPWIKAFKKVDATAPTPANAKPTGGVVAPWWAPFVSNVVAHAIAAGAIKEPGQIEPWVKGAANAAINASTDVPF